jgi:predicted RNA-binding protein YlqC (UPF0109 family)
MPDLRDVSVYHLVFKLVSALVEHNDEILVQTVLTNEGMTFSVRVHADDLQQLVGEQGRNADAIRTLIDSAGNKVKRRYSLVIEHEHALPSELAVEVVSQ